MSSDYSTYYMSTEIQNLIAKAQALSFNADGTIHHPNSSEMLGDSQPAQNNNTTKIWVSVLVAVLFIAIISFIGFWWKKKSQNKASAASFLDNEKPSMIENIKSKTFDSFSKMKTFVAPKSNNEFISTRNSLDDDCHEKEDVSAYLPSTLNRSKSNISVSTDSSNSTVEILNELSKIDKIEIKSNEMITKI